MERRRVLLVSVTAVAVALAGCGSPDDGEEDGDDGGEEDGDDGGGTGGYDL